MKNRHFDPLVAGLAIACLVTAGIASCGEAKAATFGIHTVSHHFPTRDYQNNVNPGAYVRFDNGVTLGGYRNTLGRESFYAGYTTPQFGPFALTVGAITGYQKRSTVTETITPCDDPSVPASSGCYHKNTHTEYSGVSKGAVTLLFAPSIVLPAVLGVTPRVSVIPRLGAGSSTVVHLSLERGF